jgi:hypothetical protein
MVERTSPVRTLRPGPSVGSGALFGFRVGSKKPKAVLPIRPRVLPSSATFAASTLIFTTQLRLTPLRQSETHSSRRQSSFLSLPSNVARVASTLSRKQNPRSNSTRHTLRSASASPLSSFKLLPASRSRAKRRRTSKMSHDGSWRGSCVSRRRDRCRRWL